MTSSALVWTTNKGIKAPAFFFAMNGYDVWLGNTRANKYSRKHVDCSISREEYFDFAYSEIGHYDLNAQLEFVNENTGNKKLTYIGHSLGTEQMFYALSQDDFKWYEDRVNLFVALAPITSNHNIPDGPLKNLASKVDEIDAYV